MAGLEIDFASGLGDALKGQRQKKEQDDLLATQQANALERIGAQGTIQEGLTDKRIASNEKIAGLDRSLKIEQGLIKQRDTQAKLARELKKQQESVLLDFAFKDDEESRRFGITELAKRNPMFEGIDVERFVKGSKGNDKDVTRLQRILIQSVKDIADVSAQLERSAALGGSRNTEELKNLVRIRNSTIKQLQDKKAETFGLEASSLLRKAPTELVKKLQKEFNNNTQKVLDELEALGLTI